MLTKERLAGILPAIPTPTRGTGEVDVAALRGLVRQLLSQGVDGIVPLGGTGEFLALEPLERARAVQAVVDEVAGRVPVIAGVLSPGLGDALPACRDFDRAGADAVMVITPYYVTPTQDGIRDYFRRVLDASPRPVVLYDIPYRTRVAMTPETISSIADDPRAIGIKACNLDMFAFLKLTAMARTKLAVLSGEDALYPLHVAAGAVGGVLATATLVPASWKAIHAALAAGRVEAALELHRSLFPLLDAVFAETNPGPLKSCLDLIGIPTGAPLLPLLSPGAELSDRLGRAMADLLGPGAAGVTE
jgi:4-hydroxy-tetrahydrodipicolinate synthase